MTPTHAGALQVVRESLVFLEQSIVDLPQEALDWKPLESANSATVLVVHAVTSARFFLRAGSGFEVSFAGYRSNERRAAFQSAGVAKDELLKLIRDFSAEAEEILSHGSAADVEGPVDMGSSENLPIPARNGAGTLMAAIGHLREHVGHLQLMHDIWLAR